MNNQSLQNNKLSISISKLKTSLEAIVYSQAVSKQPLVGREQLLVNYCLENFNDGIEVNANSLDELQHSSTEKFKEILSVYLANLYSVNEKHAQTNKWLDYLNSKINLSLIEKDKLPVLSYFKPNSNYVRLLNIKGFNSDKIFTDLKALVFYREKINSIFSTLIDYSYFEINSRAKDKIVSKAMLASYNGFSINENNFTGLLDLTSNKLSITSDNYDEAIKEISTFTVFQNENPIRIKVRNDLFTQSEMSIKDWMVVYKRLRNENDITALEVLDSSKIELIHIGIQQSIKDYWTLEHDNVFHSDKFISTLEYFVNLKEFTNKDKQLVDLLIKSLDFYNRNTVVLDSIGGEIIDALLAYLQVQINAYSYNE